MVRKPSHAKIWSCKYSVGVQKALMILSQRGEIEENQVIFMGQRSKQTDLTTFFHLKKISWLCKKFQANFFSYADSFPIVARFSSMI
jgi:hypothetical protein